MGERREIASWTRLKLIRKMSRPGSSMKRAQVIGAKEIVLKWLEHRPCVLSKG